jgi:hypothetical protein
MRQGMKKPTMRERNKQRSHIELTAIDLVKQEFGYTRRYVVESLEGNRVGIMPDKMIKSFKEKVKKLEAAAKEI